MGPFFADKGANVFTDLRGNPVDTAGLFSASIGRFICAHRELSKVGFYSLWDYEEVTHHQSPAHVAHAGEFQRMVAVFRVAFVQQNAFFVANTNVYRAGPKESQAPRRDPCPAGRGVVAQSAL